MVAVDELQRGPRTLYAGDIYVTTFICDLPDVLYFLGFFKAQLGLAGGTRNKN